MGQRCNLVVKKDGKWTLYYDHWAANSLDQELFWGPELSLAFVEEREPVDDDHWSGEVWCEGAAILDFDKKVLLWFGGESICYDVPSQRAHQNLMRKTWPGWQVRWAHGGIVEVAGYLGLAKERFLSSSDDRPPIFFLNDEFPQDNTWLLSVGDGPEVVSLLICGDEENLESGLVGIQSLFHLCKPVQKGAKEFPHGGAHLDIMNKTLSFWTDGYCCDIEEKVSKAWPGWEIKWWRDAYEKQLEASKGSVVLDVESEEVLQDQILEGLKDALGREASNPAREIGLLMGATDVNPRTDVTRGTLHLADARGQMLADLVSARIVPHGKGGKRLQVNSGKVGIAQNRAEDVESFGGGL